MPAGLDHDSIVPLYAQIIEQISRDIGNGIYQQTKRLPTEDELAEQYCVSRITIRRAINELVTQGIVEKKQGKGTFASEASFIHKTREQELLLAFDDLVTELFVLDVTKEDLGQRMENLEQGRMVENG